MYNFILLCESKSPGSKEADNSIRVMADDLDGLAERAVEKLGTGAIVKSGLYHLDKAGAVLDRIAVLQKKETSK